MNRKLMLIVTLVLMTIISIGCVSAAENIDDSTDVDLSDAADGTVLSEDSSPEPSQTTIEIDSSMTNQEIQDKISAELTDNTVINFAPGEYNNTKLKITKDVDYQVEEPDENGTIRNVTKTTKNTVSNVIINGNGATLKGNPGMSNYYDGIFEVANVNGFTLSGFNFICQGVMQANMKTPSCVVIFNTTNGIVENNNISGGRFGLYVGSKFLYSNFDTLIRNNTVTDVSDMGIISFGSPRSYIVNNTVINPANHGIDVRHSTGNNCTVEGNYITGAMEGIYLMHSSGHKAINNTISKSMIAITCYGSSNIICDNNTFANKTKIGFLLSSGYSNIQIGEGNDYSGLVFVPMPPTFTYNIVKANADYVAMTNGTFSQNEENKNTTYVQVFLPIGDDETYDPLEMADSSTTVLDDILLSLNTNVTVKIWKNDDNNHIEAGETINITIDDVDYSGVTDITGAVYINLDQLGPGKHYMKVKYEGFNGLKPSTWNGIIQIGDDVITDKKATVIEYEDMTTTAIDSTNEPGTGEYFKITLKDGDGKLLANKEIKFGFNGKIYNKTTDDKGIAELQINLQRADIYTFAVCFLGDDDFNSSFAVAKITVKKQTPSLTVPAKSYGANAKTKTISATFKSASGKVIAGKKITFTVNGKTYTANTNDKGVASVNVSLNKKGTYSFTAKFAGDNTYAAISKTAKLTLK